MNDSTSAQNPLSPAPSELNPRASVSDGTMNKRSGMNWIHELQLVMVLWTNAGLFDIENSIHTQGLKLALQVLEHLRWSGAAHFHGWQVLASRGRVTPLPRGGLRSRVVPPLPRGGLRSGVVPPLPCGGLGVGDVGFGGCVVDTWERDSEAILNTRLHWNSIATRQIIWYYINR